MTDYVYLKWLRHASYISASFRLELAKVLWSNATIEAGDVDQEADDEDGWYPNRVLREIKSLLSERPAIVEGIKGLRIELEFAKGQKADDLGNFASWCDHIAETLDLEDAHFTISASERDLKKLRDRKKSGLDGLAVISKLRVKDYFSIDLERVYVDDGPKARWRKWDGYWSRWNESDDSDYDSDEPLDPEYRDVLWELIMPLSLRDREPETEEEQYLKARAEEYEEIGEAEETDESEGTDEAEESDRAEEFGEMTEETEDGA
jgi:hypothetical protein